MIGAGYVGLVSGTCFAESGNEVTCVDVNRQRIDMLTRGQVPIYEPGLAELLERNLQLKRLHFTTDLPAAMRGAKLVFLCVGTPQSDDGSADLSSLWTVVDNLAPHLQRDT